MMPKNGLCLRAMIMTNEKKMNESPKYKCFICSSLCSANERIYIFSEMSNCKRQSRVESFLQIENRGKSGIQNSLSTNPVKLLDFLVSLLVKLN